MPREYAIATVKDMCRTLRALRQESGMSIGELSEKAGVTEHTLVRIEAEEAANVQFDKLCRIAFVLAGSLPGLAAEMSRRPGPRRRTGRK